MDERRGLFMEYAIVAAIVVLAIITATALTIAGHSGTTAEATLTDLIKMGFTALVTLAYAAGRGARGGSAAPPAPRDYDPMTTRTPEQARYLRDNGVMPPDDTARPDKGGPRGQ